MPGRTASTQEAGLGLGVGIPDKEQAAGEDDGWHSHHLGRAAFRQGGDELGVDEAHEKGRQRSDEDRKGEAAAQQQHEGVPASAPDADRTAGGHPGRHGVEVVHLGRGHADAAETGIALSFRQTVVPDATGVREEAKKADGPEAPGGAGRADWVMGLVA